MRMQRTGNWASSTGYWFNISLAQWLGVSGIPGEYTWLACVGDPMNMNITTVFTFGDTFTTHGDAATGLDALAASIGGYVEFASTVGSHLYGEVHPAWFNADRVTDLFPANGVRIGVVSSSIVTNDMTTYVGDTTYGSTTLANAAIDSLAAAINSL